MFSDQLISQMQKRKAHLELVELIDQSSCGQLNQIKLTLFHTLFTSTGFH